MAVSLTASAKALPSFTLSPALRDEGFTAPAACLPPAGFDDYSLFRVAAKKTEASPRAALR